MDQGYFWEVSDKISNRIEGPKFINTKLNFYRQSRLFVKQYCKLCKPAACSSYINLLLYYQNVAQKKINDLDYRKLDSSLKSFNMVQTIQKYTRIARKRNNFTYGTIDVIMTNCYLSQTRFIIFGTINT